MNPAERVRAIREIASFLADLDYPDINLYLAGFGFPEAGFGGPWRDDHYAYAVEQLRVGADTADLSGLHEVARQALEPTGSDSPADDSTSVDDDGPPWRAGYLRAFISHVHAQRAFVTALQTALLGYGIDGFVAHADIRPTHEWEEVIRAALGSCDLLIAVLDPSFKGSEWTDQEVGFCIARRVPVVPVSRGLLPYGFIGRYQALRAEGMSAEACARLVVVNLLSNPTSVDRVVEALVEKLVHANSFDQANTLADLLGPVVVTRAQAERLSEAVDRNSQLDYARRGRPYIEGLRGLFGLQGPTTPPEE